MKFTDIDMNGDVTIQLVGPGLDQLEHLMTIINEAYEVGWSLHVHVCIEEVGH